MGDMPEQMIICPNCTNGCKLIKLCFIEDTGGGGLEYKSNINITWSDLYSTDPVTQKSGLSLLSALRRFLICYACVSSSLLVPWCIKCKIFCMEQVTSAEEPFLWGGERSGFLHSRASVYLYKSTPLTCIFSQEIGLWDLEGFVLPPG